MRVQMFALILTVTTLLSHARANPTYEMYRATDGSYAFTQVDPNLQTPQAGFRAYDNWRTSTEGGISELRGFHSFGGNEIGDDLNMVTTGPALLNDLGWSIWNHSATQTLQSATFVLRLYDENRNLLFQFANPLGFAVPPQSGAAMFTNSNVFTHFGVILNPRCYMSLQYTNVVGLSLADVGGVLLGPCTTGSSSQFAYDFSGGTTINFDGTNQTNMMFFIDTATIPTPGTIGVGIVFALAVSRRRDNQL